MQIDGNEIFNKGGLMFNLCRVASLEYQDKYIVHPTKDYYILDISGRNNRLAI